MKRRPPEYEAAGEDPFSLVEYVIVDDNGNVIGKGNTTRITWEHTMEDFNMPWVKGVGTPGHDRVVNGKIVRRTDVKPPPPPQADPNNPLDKFRKVKSVTPRGKGAARQHQVQQPSGRAADRQSVRLELQPDLGRGDKPDRRGR